MHLLVTALKKTATKRKKEQLKKAVQCSLYLCSNGVLPLITRYIKTSKAEFFLVKKYRENQIQRRFRKSLNTTNYTGKM